MSYSGGTFLSGGDFLPSGEQVSGVAVVKAGTRYLGFSVIGSGVYAADITDYTTDTGPATKNGIHSELIRNLGVGAPAGITAVEAAGRSYVVVWAADALAVVDVSNPGKSHVGAHDELHVEDLLRQPARHPDRQLSLQRRLGGAAPNERRSLPPDGGRQVFGRQRGVRGRHSEPGRPVDERIDASALRSRPPRARTSRRRDPSSSRSTRTSSPSFPTSWRRAE